MTCGFPSQRVINVELWCVCCCKTEQAVEQIIELLFDFRHHDTHVTSPKCRHSLHSMKTSSKGKHFLRYWPIMRGIHQSPMDSPCKGQWCRTLIFLFISAWTNGWANNRDASDLWCHCAHYDVTVMWIGVLLALYKWHSWTCYDIIMVKGLRPFLESFVVTMHEGVCVTGFDVLVVQAREQTPTDWS